MASVRRWVVPALLLAGMTVASGCGPTAGAWLYTLGLVPDEKVAAEFKLPEAPLLILVDDELGLVQPPVARVALMDVLAQQLREHQVVDRITTLDELARLRQSAPDFDQLSIREAARRAKAETVLWINVEEFAVQDDLEQVVTPGRLAVRLKVFNALAEEKRDLRMWPAEREGRFLSVTVSVHDIRECKSISEAHRKIAEAMADKIAKLFYDHTIKREA